MSKLREFLGNVDDEYLIGLTNKGIVKRSYKDMENEQIEVGSGEEEIPVSVGEVQVTLKLPLTDSTCTCPSGSVCKHIVMAILAVNKSLGEDLNKDSNRDSNKDSNKDFNKGIDQERFTEESVPSIMKMTHAKEWKVALEMVSNMEPVGMEEGKLVTVIGEDGLIVKLAEPLNYSTCSICHDDTFCCHKAWALLSFLIKKDRIKRDAILITEDSDEWDKVNLEEVLTDLLAFLQEILMIGCARYSPETPYGLERFAIRCHGAGLALLENKTRVLAQRIKDYQQRKAKVTAQELMQGIAECFALADRTRNALRGENNIAPMLGTFRSKYREIPEITLFGVGIREFVSDAGYRGHTIYFIEEKSGIFYTYTTAIPTIYDTNKKTDQQMNHLMEKVPWGLPCTLQQMARAKIHLLNGKANMERRLSSSGLSKGELISNNVPAEEIADWTFDEFDLLWKEYSSRTQGGRSGDSDAVIGGATLSEADKLFFIKPSQICEMNYDEVLQCLVFYLQDVQGRRLKAKVKYSKQEETAIRSLERLWKNYQKKKEGLPVFLGSLYVENGECIFYPIETFDYRDQPD